jgi:hypothetical protein
MKGKKKKKRRWKRKRERKGVEKEGWDEEIGKVKGWFRIPPTMCAHVYVFVFLDMKKYKCRKKKEGEVTLFPHLLHTLFLRNPRR